MTETASLRVATLLASRLCHDLIGPLGAVDNGLELLAEEGALAEEALALARRSAKRAASRLRFFRYAFGAAGEDPGFGPAEAQLLAENLLHGSEIQLSWRADGEGMPAGSGRLLLNLVLLGIDCLPRGGLLHILARPGLFVLDCRAPHARLSEELSAAILRTLAPADLTARTVVGYFAALLAIELGGRLEIGESSRERVYLLAAVGNAQQVTGEAVPREETQSRRS